MNGQHSVQSLERISAVNNYFLFRLQANCLLRFHTIGLSRRLIPKKRRNSFESAANAYVFMVSVELGLSHEANLH